MGNFSKINIETRGEGGRVMRKKANRGKWKKIKLKSMKTDRTEDKSINKLNQFEDTNMK